MTAAQRVAGDLNLIGFWILLWLGTVVVGMQLGFVVVGPEGRDGYAVMTGLVGVLIISPLGLLCSTFFLWVKRRVVLFVLCAVPVGLAITLWPLLGWIFPGLNG